MLNDLIIFAVVMAVLNLVTAGIMTVVMMKVMTSEKFIVGYTKKVFRLSKKIEATMEELEDEE